MHLAARHGNVDACIAAHGYLAYARANVAVFSALTDVMAGGVVALSSGLMTYPPDVHPAYAAVREAIARHLATFVLLPSLDLEVCAAETVRRQVRRGAGRTTAARAEAVIRARFALYAALPASTIVTMRPPGEAAAEIVDHLAEIAPGEPS